MTNTLILVCCVWACVGAAFWHYGAGAAVWVIAAAWLAAWAEASRRV